MEFFILFKNQSPLIAWLRSYYLKVGKTGGYSSIVTIHII
jgi:hypothetical protein